MIIEDNLWGQVKMIIEENLWGQVKICGVKLK